jgi:hypothetical protein
MKTSKIKLSGLHQNFFTEKFKKYFKTNKNSRAFNEIVIIIIGGRMSQRGRASDKRWLFIFIFNNYYFLFPL